MTNSSQTLANLNHAEIRQFLDQISVKLAGINLVQLTTPINFNECRLQAWLS